MSQPIVFFNPIRLIALMGILVISSCSPELSTSRGPTPCSEEWFQFVEGRLSTGDSQGHGPDLGSSEWRSVVEFKLGIRGKPTIPNRSTMQWCTYIDEKLTKSEG
jgi:hypothetical protein